MKFNSLKEYFSKLNIWAYQLLMIPLLIFILYYSQTLTKLSFIILDKDASRILLISLSSFSIIWLTTVHIISVKRAVKISKEISLGLKLELLGDVLVGKMKKMSALIIAIPVALLVTGEEYFSALFAVTFFWYVIQWPTPARVSRMLKLKGDEKIMVLTRGEAFK